MHTAQTNPKTQTNKSTNSPYRELEDRTFNFAKRCRDFVTQLTKNIHNIEYGKQLVRSSGSQAANYIEANEALSKKDFVMRVKICRKETKESCLWLRLCDAVAKKEIENERTVLLREAEEIRKIFNAILGKST